MVSGGVLVKCTSAVNCDGNLSYTAATYASAVMWNLSWRRE